MFSEFEVGYVYIYYGVFKILECRGDSSEVGKKLFVMGYGEKCVYYGEKEECNIFKKKWEGLIDEQLVNYVMIEFGKWEIEVQEMIKNLIKIWGECVCIFWDVNDKNQVVINCGWLIDFLY